MNTQTQHIDIVLIGGGIMSATLGVLLHELMPEKNITIFERLEDVALESSDSWNNAGTGHSAYCELNYTPLDADGNINISKAIKIAEQFEQTKQFWTYLIENNKLSSASDFLHQIPHCSFVMGENDKNFLQKRYESLRIQPLFESMIYSDDINTLESWIPLVMNNRAKNEICAATKMDIGCDIDFGKLTSLLFKNLLANENVNLYLQHEVRDLNKNEDGSWEIEIKNLSSKEKLKYHADFVFVGAGGGALKLLNKADIPEIDGFGGFPVGGKWLRCSNEKTIKNHHSKVYGLAQIGAPPMSVPHLDTRIIQGEKELLFGPYAGFSTKFLKHGSFWDLPFSLDWDNLMPMIEAGYENLPLTKYLIDQVRMSFDEKFESLKIYYPNAEKKDWELIEAGQRVQVIKKDINDKGVLEFGTELIHNQERSIAGLLGASPGASTAPSIMIKLIDACFSNLWKNEKNIKKINEIFPSYHISLNENKELLLAQRARCHNVLGIV